MVAQSESDLSKDFHTEQLVTGRTMANVSQ